MANNAILPRQSPGFFTAAPSSSMPRHGHCLDDMDILTLKRQYANIDLFNQSALSNSAEDLTQLDRSPYPCDIFGQDDNDADDYDLPYDDGSAYEYSMMIQERLKKANEELEHDDTPSELLHRQRVSFDAMVKAVDIIHDPAELGSDEDLNRPSVSPVLEEASTNTASSCGDSNTHEYTVPLNDTHPREGLTLLQQIKALQFHNTTLTNPGWPNGTDNLDHTNSTDHQDNSSSNPSKPNDTDNTNKNSSNETTDSATLKRAVIVAVNGRFDLRNEDDCIAKPNSKSTNDDEKKSTITKKISFIPTPPTEPKKKQETSHRPLLARPKSSEIGKRTEISSAKSSSEKKNPNDFSTRPRPKSAGVPKTIEAFVEKPSSGVDFNELLRQAVVKKRTELREERLRKEEAEEKRQQELARAKESYLRWLQEKDAERKRINEEKRAEDEQKRLRQVEEEQELADLREKKFKEWLERKEQEAKIANEFKKLKAEEEEMVSGGSSSSINNGRRDSDHRAFQRWLRRKYEQSIEQKRLLRLEAKRQRRRQRRSIKRNQLQQDLQLAKSFGYS